jgi:hypothetical protein
MNGPLTWEAWLTFVFFPLGFILGGLVSLWFMVLSLVSGLVLIAVMLKQHRA